jgi:hypothetical protein
VSLFTVLPHQSRFSHRGLYSSGRSGNCAFFVKGILGMEGVRLKLNLAGYYRGCFHLRGMKLSQQIDWIHLGKMD